MLACAWKLTGMPQGNEEIHSDLISVSAPCHSDCSALCSWLFILACLNKGKLPSLLVFYNNKLNILRFVKIVIFFHLFPTFF